MGLFFIKDILSTKDKGSKSFKIRRVKFCDGREEQRLLHTFDFDLNYYLTARVSKTPTILLVRKLYEWKIEKGQTLHDLFKCV